MLEEKRNYTSEVQRQKCRYICMGSWREVIRNGEPLRRTCDVHTRKQLLAIFLSRLVITKDELVTHPVATNPVKGQRGANATDDEFTVNR